jgi:hypothetical protein
MYHFSIIAALRRLWSVSENVMPLTSWHSGTERSNTPLILRDIRDGQAFQHIFLRSFGESKYNMFLSINGDSVQKSAITDKSVHPIFLRVESVDPRYKEDANLSHLATLLQGDYNNVQMSIKRLAAELAALNAGVYINIAGVGRRKVRACVAFVGGDLRALPGLVGDTLFVHYFISRSYRNFA